MSNVIENFAELSAQEQKTFADNLIEKINEEGLFTEYFDFRLTESDYYRDQAVKVDEMTGNLELTVESTTLLEFVREATWIGDSKYDTDGSDVDFIGNDREEFIKQYIHATTATIDGYLVTFKLEDVVYDNETSIEVTDYDAESGGGDSYEYWGSTVYDDEYTIYHLTGEYTYDDADFLATLTIEPAPISQ